MNVRNQFYLFALALALGMPTAQAHANADLYRKVALSTVGVANPIQDVILGSGSLIDVERRLIVTAEHVVAAFDRNPEGMPRVLVYFGQSDAKGNIINDKFYYTKYKAKLAIGGKVVARDRLRDVAIIQLDRLPPGVKALPLAKDGPTPGEKIHVIGQSGVQHGGVFNFCTGFVRNVYNWEPGSEMRIGKTIASQIPTNKGDSGGPVFNDKGELVGIVSSGTIGEPSKQGQWTFMQQVIDHSVHVSEIKQLLDNLPKTSVAIAEDPAVPNLIRDLADGQDEARLRAVQALAKLGGSAKGALATLRRVGNEADDGAFKDAVKIAVKRIESATSAPVGFQRAGIGSGVFSLIALPTRDAGMEMFFLPFAQGEKVTVEIKGTNGSDLDLVILEETGKLLVSETGLTDHETGRFTASYTGMYAVKVLNVGNQPNPYTLTTTVGKTAKGTTTVVRSIKSKAADKYQFQFEAGREARATVRGDGETPLQVSVFDDKGKEIMKSAGGTAPQVVTFAPPATGMYTIRVQNAGEVWNRYTLTLP